MQHSVRNIFPDEHDFVDQEVVGCDSVFDTCGSVVPVVRNINSSHFHWKLFRLQKNGNFLKLIFYNFSLF